MMQKKGIALLALCLALASLPGCNSFFSSTSASHVVYVTVPNQGVEAFRLDNKTGESTSILGSPFTTGNSPFAIQVHPSKKFLYVSNTADNTISLFNIDATSGALTEVMPVEVRTAGFSLAYSLATTVGGGTPGVPGSSPGAKVD